MNIGDVSEVVAWVNRQPPGPPSLHVKGFIVAPTPCHTTSTKHIGDSKSLPPIYLLRVDTHPGGTCIQMLSRVPFHHVEANYAGNHGQVQVGSETSGVTVPIGTAS